MKAGALERESIRFVDAHAVCRSQQGLSGLTSDHFSLFELFFPFQGPMGKYCQYHRDQKHRGVDKKG